MIMGTYLAYLGLVLFSLSLNKHFKEVTKKDLDIYSKNIAKISGLVLLACSLGILINDMGISLGITYLTGILAVLTLLVAFIYTYKPKNIIKLSIVLFLISLIISIL